MKKLLIYTSFGLTLGAMVASFMLAKTYTQLAIASAVYPAIAYVGFKLFFDTKGSVQTKKRLATIAQRPVSESKQEKRGIDIIDIDKRAFLKIIGGAGLSFFLFSLFAKKAEDVLFTKPAATESGFGMANTSANTGQPMDGYRISEIDDGDNTYYGFINKNGAWFIMKEDPASGTYRYAKGDDNFPAGWSTRKTLQYDYYHNLF